MQVPHLVGVAVAVRRAGRRVAVLEDGTKLAPSVWSGLDGSTAIEMVFPSFHQNRTCVSFSSTKPGEGRRAVD